MGKLHKLILNLHLTRLMYNDSKDSWALKTNYGGCPHVQCKYSWTGG